MTKPMRTINTWTKQHFLQHWRCNIDFIWRRDKMFDY